MANLLGSILIVISCLSLAFGSKPLIDPTQQIASKATTNIKLYDLANDKYEMNDVSNDINYTSAVEDLQNRLTSWQANAKVPWVPISSNQAKIWEQNNGIVPWISSPSTIYEYDITYKSEKSPHIVFVMVDDWGYNDLGMRSTYLSWTTPTIDSLAQDGVNLENYQTYQTCSPARGSFLTGKYPLRLGLWELHDQAELPTTETTIAEALKTVNYKTYLVGKWHAGSSTSGHLPNSRGFDYFYGFYSSYIDYWTKKYEGYLDLHENDNLVSKPEELDDSLHSAHLFQSKAEEVIAKHSTTYPDQPMFLYYAMQLIHSPWTAPDEYLSRCEMPSIDVPSDSQLTPDILRNMCGMNLMLDEAIANLTCTLKKYDMQDNTILVIASDNGGEATIPGNSYPYKGHKGSFYRGGLSTTAIIHSPLIPKEARGSTYNGLVHVSDWYPTLMGLATSGTWTNADETLDGKDVWDAIITNSDSPHEEIVHLLDGEKAVIQVKDLKLFSGQPDNIVDSPAFVFSKDLHYESRNMLCESPSLIYHPWTNFTVFGKSYDVIAHRVQRLMTFFITVVMVAFAAAAIAGVRYRFGMNKPSTDIPVNMSKKPSRYASRYGSTMEEFESLDSYPLINKA